MSPANTPTIPRAIKELRLRLGDTQQRFANRLNLAISTVVRYESTRPPKGKALAELYKIAADSGLDDVALMFRQAVEAELTGLVGHLEVVWKP
jgi:transcriptional regulator with XRE-family HTH domain